MNNKEEKQEVDIESIRKFVNCLESFILAVIDNKEEPKKEFQKIKEKLIKILSED